MLLIGIFFEYIFQVVYLKRTQFIATNMSSSSCPLLRIFDLFLIRQFYGKASTVFQRQNFRLTDPKDPTYPTFNLLPALKTLKSQVSKRFSVHFWRLMLSTETFVAGKFVCNTRIKNNHYETFVICVRLPTQRCYKYSTYWVFKATALSIYLFIFFYPQFSARFLFCTMFVR